MKIDRRTVQDAAGAYRVGGPKPAAKKPEAQAQQTSQGADSVNVSQKAQQATALRAKLRESPEVRMDLVQRIKAQVEAGTYNVEPRKVAEKLLKSKVLE